MDDLQYHVQRMLDAGVDREKIKAYVRKHGATNKAPDATGQPVGPTMPDAPVTAGTTPGEGGGGMAGNILGRTVRAGAKGTLGTLGDLGAGALNTLNAALGGDPNYFQSGSATIDRVLDSLGVARSANASEQFWDNAGSALASAALPIKTGRMMAASPAGSSLAAPTVAQGVGQTLQAMPGMQAASTAGSSAAGQLAEQAGAAPGWQAAAYLGGGMVPMTATAAARGAGSLVNPEKLAAFRQAGITPPSVGAVSDSGTVQGMEAALSQGLFSRGTMADAQRRGMEGFTRAVDQSANRLSGGRHVPYDLDEAGLLARQAAEAGRDRFRNVSRLAADRAYGPVDAGRANLDTTLSSIRNEAGTLSPHEGVAYENRLIGQLGEIYNDNAIRQLNVKGLRKGLERIGERLEAPQTANPSDAGQGEMKWLWSNMRTDLERAVEEAGGGQKVNRFRSWYSGRKGDIEDVETAFFKNRDDSAVARAVLTAEGSQLEKLRRVVGHERFQLLRAAALRQIAKGGGPAGNMGYASPAEVGKALGFGKGAMPQSAQNVLFGNEAGTMRTLANAFNESRLATNTSNTAGALDAMSTATDPGFWGRVGRSVAGLTGAAKVTTSPDTIRFLESLRAMGIGPVRQAAVPVGINGMGLLQQLDED